MSTTSTIVQRLAALRSAMKENGIDLYLLPTSDPHNNEYVADHWKGREWTSGFTGSAGTLVVTTNKAALWTDSRYFLQAEKELSGTGIELMRMGVTGVPPIHAWMKVELGYEEDSTGYLSFHLLGREPRIGVDLLSISLESYLDFCQDLWDFVQDVDLLQGIWANRPALPAQRIYEQPEGWSGESMQNKVEQLRKVLRETKADHYILNDISEIAWLLNLRGNDISYNPLFLSYLVVSASALVLFVSPKSIDENLGATLQQQHIAVRPYEEAESYIRGLASSKARCCYALSINARFHAWFEKAAVNNGQATQGFGAELLEGSPITLARAIKNEAEIAGFRRAMRIDGAALVRFRRELDEKLLTNAIAHETEWSIAQRLEQIRAEHPEFRGLSFATIAGYAANGAIVHYEATAEAHAPLRNRSFLLLDSGAHYVSGTTDITRTIPLGLLTDEERKAYTLVLKGLIQLSMAHFPEGTTGLALDFAARQPLWREGYDFGHGTGHGVGSHLCVHEGPQQIRKDRRAATEVPFRAGMTVSNEPGIYVAGAFGVRLENILVATEAENNGFGHFLRFETLTLCPFDCKPLLVEMLEPQERDWLNAYHDMVRRELMPFLSDDADKDWLFAATTPV